MNTHSELCTQAWSFLTDGPPYKPKAYFDQNKMKWNEQNGHRKHLQTQVASEHWYHCTDQRVTLVNSQGRSKAQHAGSVWSVSGSTRWDFRWWVGVWGIPSSWQGSTPVWSHPSHLEQTGWTPVACDINHFDKQCCKLFLKLEPILTTPEDRTLFKYSRNPSSLISLSVKMKVIPLPCCPATRYRYLRSSSRLDTL